MALENPYVPPRQAFPYDGGVREAWGVWNNYLGVAHDLDLSTVGCLWHTGIYTPLVVPPLTTQGVQGTVMGGDNRGGNGGILFSGGYLGRGSITFYSLNKPRSYCIVSSSPPPT